MAADFPPVFISYKSEDRALAEALYRRLTAAGFAVWFDQPALDRVTRWHEEIEAACEHARVILPVITPRWRSLWTEFETYGGEQVLPLIFEGEGPPESLLPEPLREWQCLDMRGAGEETWQKLFRRLREALEKPPPDKRQRLAHLPIGANPYFVGREKELLELHAQLCRAPATVLTHGPAFVVAGLGGVGKTTLARQYAEKFWRLYQDILWVNATVAANLPLEFARLTEELGVARGDEAAADARRALHELTQGPRRLLILDNAQDEASVLDWIPTAGKCRTIITSRFTAWSAAVQTMHVYVLEAAPACALLLRRSGLPDTEEHRAAADRLAKELEYLPLALEQAAAYIAVHQLSLERYLELYAKHRQELLAAGVLGSTRYRDSVATTWDLSVQRLSPAARSLLGVLAWVASAPLPREVLRQAPALLGLADEWAVDQALGELQRYSLVRLEAGDGPLTIHRLLQAVQQDRLSREEQRGRAAVALAIIQRAFPPPDFRTWRRCETLLPHALACCQHAQTYDLTSPEAGYLSGCVGDFYLRRGQVSPAWQPFERAREIFSRLAASDPTNAE